MTAHSDAYSDACDEMDALIRAHDLHDSWPVDLTPLETRFPAVRRDLGADGPRAFAVPPTRAGMPTWIVLDRCLREPRRRVVYAHEVGHALLAHVGSARALDAGGTWLHTRQEGEAWALAARLLIPIEAWGWGDPVADVAARCGVPEWLARKYPGAWVG